MKCVIPGTNLKVFGRCIHSLGKIGDEIYFEARTDGMSIGTVNSSRCAYMNFFFKTTFFYKFSTTSKSGNNDPVDSLKCKVYTKSCLAVFKSLASLEKSVDRCVIMLDVKGDRFIFLLHCKHGLTKTYNLTFIESEKLDAIFDIEDYPSDLLIQSKLFVEVVGNFQPSTEELSLQLSEDRAVVTNHIPEIASNTLRTEVQLASEEFDSFNVASAVEVVFCLKEFRALLFFCEGPELQFSVHVRAAGEPIVFVVDSDPTFNAHLVLSTIPPSRLTTHPTTPKVNTTSTRKAGDQSLAQTSNLKIQKKKGEARENLRRNVLFNVSNSRRDSEEEETNINESVRILNATTRDRVENFDDEVSSPFVPPTTCRARRHVDTRKSPDDAPHVEPSKHDDASRQRSASRNKRRAESSGEENTPLDGGNRKKSRDEQHCPLSREPSTAFRPIDEDDDGGRRGEDGADDDRSIHNEGGAVEVSWKHTCHITTVSSIFDANVSLALSKQAHTEGDDNNDDDDDVVPGTPPRTTPNKRFKALFFGLSQSQEDSTNQSCVRDEEKMECRVLAEDSDPE